MWARAMHSVIRLLKHGFAKVADPMFLLDMKTEVNVFATLMGVSLRV